MARRRVSAGAASTPIHQIGIQGRTTKALHGCSVVIKSSTSVVGPYAWVRSGGGRNKLSVQTIGLTSAGGGWLVGPTGSGSKRGEEAPGGWVPPGGGSKGRGGRCRPGSARPQGRLAGYGEGGGGERSPAMATGGAGGSGVGRRRRRTGEAAARPGARGEREEKRAGGSASP
ncbi:uncharacterized protein [Oryza sativa Japonica Group]|uniref:Os08g0326900 protein n=1 Tax=Oryza sativa subsp. japonica TaxID=39947 RepID=B7F655_ORYSJ|nr:glycine-rich cell wall structural protein 2-like isoform X2 [Oryza sativa Japonica Group]BAH00103.1 unnamed protein product [Oryza sativa Japonica Group]BAT04910.1 Os08g0326900 [Oryza sativa Japonica Group]